MSRKKKLERLTHPEVDHNGFWIAFLVAASFVIVLWLAVGYAVPFAFKLSSWDNDAQSSRGAFGDQFGAANALFSGLAFAGVVAALILQHRTHAIESDRNRRQLVLPLAIDILNDIRSSEWGEAHDKLAKWQRDHPNDFDKIFSQCRNISNHAASTIDEHRRVFVKPFHKAWRLADLCEIDRDIARKIVPASFAYSLLNIVEPLEAGIRTNYEQDGYGWIRDLYTSDELMEWGSFKQTDVALCELDSPI